MLKSRQKTTLQQIQHIPSISQPQFQHSWALTFLHLNIHECISLHLPSLVSTFVSDHLSGLKHSNVGFPAWAATLLHLNMHEWVPSISMSPGPFCTKNNVPTTIYHYSTAFIGLTFLHQRLCPHHHIPLFDCIHCIHCILSPLESPLCNSYTTWYF